MQQQTKEKHQYKCEVVEADRDGAVCGYSRQMVYCLDTDGYIVGLRNQNASVDIVVELTKIGSKDRNCCP